MEVLDFLTKYWPLLSAIGGLVVVIWRLTVKEVKVNQITQTQLLTQQISSKFNELKVELTGENNVIKVKLENLCEHVRRQNGRLDKTEAWQLEHTEHYHSRRDK